MKYIILDVPSEHESEQLVESNGAFYSKFKNAWLISEGLLTYPQSRKKNFRPYLSNNLYNPKDEDEYKTVLYEELSRYFNIVKEVRGRHITGAKVILDWVLSPKDTKGWKNSNVVFGIEFKHPDKLDSKSNFTYWAKQAIDYGHTDWDGYGCIPIFMGPASERLFFEGASSMRDLLYAFKIGYCTNDSGFKIHLAGKKVWCQAYGVQDIGRSSWLTPTFGARKSK